MSVLQGGKQSSNGRFFKNWDKEVFRAVDHPKYMFIQDFEVVIIDDHVETIDALKRNGYGVEKDDLQWRGFR